MEENSTKADANSTALFAGEAWFDPIEAGIRERVRGFIEELIGQELEAALGRGRYERDAEAPKGYRNGTRERQLLGSFGLVELSVPRARMAAEGGGTQEWRSAALPRYARMTRQVEALIAGAYLAGTNTRRVKRALAALFKGAVGKDVVSRTWRKVRTDWEAWNGRDLAREDVVRLILDGTVGADAMAAEAASEQRRASWMAGVADAEADDAADTLPDEDSGGDGLDDGGAAVGADPVEDAEVGLECESVPDAEPPAPPRRRRSRKDASEDRAAA